MFGNQDKDDFFDGPDLPDKEPEPKKPVLKPEDPDYWEEDESEWDHLRPTPGRKPFVVVSAILILLAVLVFLWIYLFVPSKVETVQYGYVEQMERRGSVFKTREGVLLPYRELHDSTRNYSGDFVFSVPDKLMYKELRNAMKECRPVVVEYSTFRCGAPWRGESKIVVTRVDSVDPSLILPPEFRR